MNGERRFSQAISEGDGISVVAEAADGASAASAAAAGADALVVRGEVGAFDRTLPVLWRGGSAGEAVVGGADAWTLVAAEVGDDDHRLAAIYAEVLDQGLDCVVEVADEEELERVLESLDPEVFLLSSSTSRDGDPLEQVLELLLDVPAGKLAVADAGSMDRESLDELERAGVDAVIVTAEAVGELTGPR